MVSEKNIMKQRNVQKGILTYFIKKYYQKTKKLRNEMNIDKRIKICIEYNIKNTCIIHVPESLKNNEL